MSIGTGPTRPSGSAGPGGTAGPVGAVVAPRRSWSTRIGQLAIFVGVPILEIAVLIQVGTAIGFWWTFLLVLATSAAGAYVLTRQARRATGAARAAVRDGRLPDGGVLDAGLGMAGGALLILPGFVTDLVGLIMLLPFLRPITRRIARRAVTSGFRRYADRFGAGEYSDLLGARFPGGPTAARPGTGTVVEGEILDDDPPRR